MEAIQISIVTLRSKLSATAYKTAPPEQWLTGADYRELDPVFAGRLACLARDKKVNLSLTEAYRSTARQAELYRQYQEYLRTGKGSIKSAARPGTSWHEFRLAVDTSTQPIRGMTNAQLKPYGLCKPIASEGWHIQPIETAGKTNRAAYAPEEVEDMTEAEVLKLIEQSRKVYKKPADLPEWAKPAITKMIKAGHIAPGADGSINMSEDLVRTLVILDRRLG